MFDMMYRALIKLCIAVSLSVLAGAAGWWVWHSSDDQRKIADLEAQKQVLAQQKQQLEQVVSRLGTNKRVADLIVTGRKQIGEQVATELLFVEYDRAGKPMEPRQYTIAGVMAHVEAMVIEFERQKVVENDPLKGHAITLFTRIFGENESPASAKRIDSPGGVPEFYRSAEPGIAAFEQLLWSKFWQLESDANLRQEMGVRVAVGKGVWGPFEPDMLYTITLTPDGNLSRTAEPMRGVYQTYIQLLRQKLTSSTEP
ncbi:MAG: hypothetical protein H7144_08460 [Burkholderiales bacterium]|nr:hypothetical protein [Phycisphaerae bacterium]